MNKAYERINWENAPSTATKLNATNLNKMDLGLDTIDDRVIELDTNKADKSIVKAGNPITFNITDGGVFDKAEVEFSPIQDLHGYDKPWVGGAGKNKVNVDDTNNIQGYINPTGDIISNSAWTTTPPLPITSGVPYVLSGLTSHPNTGTDNYRLLDSNKDFIEVQRVGVSQYPATFPSGTYYVQFCWKNDEKATVQFEQGSEATPYEPYSNICPITGNTEIKLYQSNGSTTTPDETYTATLGGTYYGGTYDYTTGKLTVDRAIVDLGSLSWGKHPSLKWFYNATLNNFKFDKITTDTKYGIGICSNYKFVQNKAYSNGDITLYYDITNDRYRLIVCDSDKWDTMTDTEFKTAMSGVQLVYELATPTETTLTPTQISALVGDNAMWTDGDKVTVRISTLIDSEYVMYDSNTSVKQKLDELSNIFPMLDGGTVNDLNISDRVAGTVSMALFGSNASNKPGTGGGYVQTFINVGTTDFGRQITFGNEGIFTRKLQSGNYGTWSQIV